MVLQQSLPITKPSPFARNHLLRDASLKAVYDAMKADPSIHMFGEGCAVKVHYDAKDIERDFLDRVHTMPISEDGNTNMAVGAALLGVKPIVDIISADFLYRAMDSICNTAAKLDFVTGKPHTIVVRAETLMGGPTTGQRPESLFVHIPGLRIVMPSTPHDAYGLMWAALNEPGVTLYFEDRMIDDSGPWDDEDLKVGMGIPLGLMRTRMMGQRGICTVVTYGVMRQRIERVLAECQWHPGLRADLIDLRSIYPIDFEYLAFALKRTMRLLIVEPDVTYGGVGAEIAAWAAETMPRVRVKRLGAPRTTIPASVVLHQHYLPSDKEIVDAINNW